MRILVQKWSLNFIYFFGNDAWKPLPSIMEKVVDTMEARGVILFLHLKGYSAKKIHDEMKLVYYEECPSQATPVRFFFFL